MTRPKNDKPAGTSFVGYSALTHNTDKIKKRRRFDKLKESAALDQLIYGASLLRLPQTDAEKIIYRQYSVIRSSKDEYFTTVKPLPVGLQPYFVGVKPTRDELVAIQEKAEAARRFFENL